MKKTITIHEFVNEMTDHGFTRLGSARLFEYFEELECDMDGLELEFDPIAFRCEWTEYKQLSEIAFEYEIELNDVSDLQDYTQVIEFDGGIIIQNF